jgi:hypothetical protein
MSVCHGNGDTHCCYVNGNVCQFLIQDATPSRRWSCGLFVELEDWALVHTDPRYLESVRPHWIESGTPDCGDWVGPGCCYDSTVDDPRVRATYLQACARAGTPVQIRRFWGVER